MLGGISAIEGGKEMCWNDSFRHREVPDFGVIRITLGKCTHEPRGTVAMVLRSTMMRMFPRA
jgi:hypothetical protein